MGAITEIRMYRFDGGTFSCLEHVARHIENEIGKIIDSTPNRLTAADALAVYNAIASHGDRLAFLLTSAAECQTWGKIRGAE